jgi:hypothetical protein
MVKIELRSYDFQAMIADVVAILQWKFRPQVERRTSADHPEPDRRNLHNLFQVAVDGFGHVDLSGSVRERNQRSVEITYE